MDETDDEAMRNSALMLAYNGLTPRDIAECLNVIEAQVIAWLRDSSLGAATDLCPRSLHCRNNPRAN